MVSIPFFFALYGAHCWGIDISTSAIEAVGTIEKANNVEDLCYFEARSATELPFAGEYFDYVVFNAVYHHVVKYPDVLVGADRKKIVEAVRSFKCSDHQPDLYGDGHKAEKIIHHLSANQPNSSRAFLTK